MTERIELEIKELKSNLKALEVVTAQTIAFISASNPEAGMRKIYQATAEAFPETKEFVEGLLTIMDPLENSVN